MPSSPLSLAATALIALGGAVTGFAASAQMAPGAAPPSASTPMPGSGSMDQPPPVSNARPPSAQTGAAANTSAAVPLADGMTVKDNTGASIGIISKMAADASGGEMVTIKMGADAFQVPAANLAVNNGAAEINLTKAQIESQLHPAAPK